MLLEDIGPHLEAAKVAAKDLLGRESLTSKDYIPFEDALGRLCEKALVGSDLYFKVQAIMSAFSMNHLYIQKLLDVSSKDGFRELCGQALAEVVY